MGAKTEGVGKNVEMGDESSMKCLDVCVGGFKTDPF